MRVISGQARGMRIEAPPGDDVRPVPDMAREAIFNILQTEIAEASALDLFAGSGAMGIEALSRGAEWCVFVERSRRVCRVLEKNLANTRLAEFCDIVQRDVFRCREALQKLGRAFDLVFCCPPFPMLANRTERDRLLALLGDLAQSGLFRAGAHVILQHERRSSIPETVPGLTFEQQRHYGRNLISFYTPRAAES